MITICADLINDVKDRHTAWEWATRKAVVCPDKTEFAAIAKLLADGS